MPNAERRAMTPDEAQARAVPRLGQRSDSQPFTRLATLVIENHLFDEQVDIEGKTFGWYCHGCNILLDRWQECEYVSLVMEILKIDIWEIRWRKVLK